MEISATTALQGLIQAQSKVETAARRIAAAPSNPIEDTVTLLSAKNEFAANIKVLRVADEMEKNIIDLLG